MEIYNLPVEEGYYSIKPFSIVLTLLNSQLLFYIIPVITVCVFGYVLFLLWELHELPTWQARRGKLPQVALITALTILGLFVHWVWPIAYALAFLDWKVIEKTIIRMLFFVKNENNLDEIYKKIDEKHENKKIEEGFWTLDLATISEKHKEEEPEDKKIEKKPSIIVTISKNIYRILKEKFTK